MYGYALLFITITLLISPIHFYKQLGSGPSAGPQSCLYFLKIFRAQSWLTVGWSVLWPNKQILSVFHWFVSGLQLSRFYEIHSLVIWTFWKHFLVPEKLCCCLFCIDDSALKVDWQIAFRGPVAHKSVAYENKVY